MPVRSQEELSDLAEIDERPNEVQWGMLFELAREYKKLKPWEVLSDCDIFGLKLPWRDETVYPLVMGNSGEFFGLSVYRGGRGLLHYFMTTSDMDPDDPVYLASHNNLLLSFLDREMLGKDDLSLMRSLGVSFRGKRGWAQFRRMRGLHLDGRITAEEADLLLEVIPRVLTMAETARKDQDVADFFEHADVPVFEETAPLEWKLVPFSEPAEDPQKVLDEAFPKDGIRRIGRLKQEAGSWQVGWKGIPGLVVEDPEDPVRPVGAMIVDGASGFILGFHAFAGEDLEDLSREFCEEFVGMLEKAGAAPGRLEVQSKWLYGLLKPLQDRLGTKLVLKDSLPELEEAFDYLVQESGQGHAED
jgi:hypothetical protein